MPGAIHVGCAHSEHTQCAHTSRRAFLKGGIAIVGGAGMATVVDPGEVFAQVRVFPEVGLELLDAAGRVMASAAWSVTSAAPPGWPSS